MNNNEVAAVDRVTEQEIRLQLERILLSPPFRGSKRHPRFLRFVVDKTLSGAAQDIKERIIGAEVFDRDIHYDVSSDPIVRVAAGEIRKRLAQYYIQPGHEVELRIELPPGSYVPSFYMPHRGDDVATDERSKPDRELQVALLPGEGFFISEPAVPASDSATNTVNTVRRNRVLVAIAAALAVLLLIALGYFVWSREHRHATNLEVFWQPLLGSNSGTILCIGDLNYLIQDRSPTLPSDISRILAAHDHISGIDAVAMARIVGFMGEHNRYAIVFLADNATLTDLRGKPAIHIGAFNNHWTGELLSSYRFQFQHDAINKLGTIRDTHNPAQAWTIDLRSPPAAVHKDYALISRIRSSITEQAELMIAGIGPSGTVAATEFVTNPRYFNEFTKLAPKGWENRELQIVITTDVIGERPAPPHVLAFDVR
ncbi:hypothetical protein [Edaphobacter flagellatus]|uniref:hypothetical protein n=1 Tax=Edaphobacter flagellatus TaxID=1933044 RepID=UPI0021B44780|nr:hypothetical protein [Edaphobacter flagellatus]